MEIWFLLIKQEDSLSSILINDKPEKIKYRAYQMYFEGVLFLAFTNEMEEHLQDIGFLLGEQRL